MKIGILNRLLPGITLEVHYAGSALPVPLAQDGDPLLGQSLSFPWQPVKDQPVALTLRLPKKVFVDTVVLETGESTKLISAVLTDGSHILSQHCAETGKTVTDSCLELAAGCVTDCVALQLTDFFSGITVNAITLYGALEDGADLFPLPKTAAVSGKTLPAAAFKSYSGSDLAGKVLAEKFFEKTGITLAPAESGDIRFVTDPSIPTDGYRLTFAEGKSVIAASTQRGLVSGGECFIKLTDKNRVSATDVTDFPDRPFRGVHLYMPSLAEMPFAKRLFKYLLSPMGYNTAIIEVGASMRFDSQPKVNEAFLEAVEKSRSGQWPEFPHYQVGSGTVLEKADIREFLDYIRSFGIEPIPEIQSLGHVQYITQAYPEIAEREDKDYNAEIDFRGEDFRPAGFYAHCYCPSNEKSYDILFDIMDEIIDVFQPKGYVHMGHDEVYQIGICPKCAGKDPADLYAQDIRRIHGHLAEKGLKMMIWADMLQPCTVYRTPPAIDRIPTDIVMLDFIWYFHFDKDLEDNLLNKGFRVAAGNLYSSHYPRYESRMAKPGMLGGEISTWVGTNEKELQQEGKFFDFFLTAHMLWNADSYHHCHSRALDAMISARMPQLRDDLRGVRSPSLQEGTKAVTLVENPISFPPTAPSQKTEFSVETPCKSLVLYHTALRKYTRDAWQPHPVVGNYILTFADGSRELLPITMNGNIGYWNRRQNSVLPHPIYRHNGYTAGYFTDGISSKTADGRDVTVYRLEHILPEGKQLISVSLEEDAAFDPQIFLCKAEAITL